MFSTPHRILRSSRTSASRYSRSWDQHRSNSSISALQAAFRDPASPFYIAPGTIGPSTPENAPSVGTKLDTTASLESKKDFAELLQSGREKLKKAGFDPASFWEQKIVWGDHDSFQHVNNARYVRFFESARINWMASFGDEFGGPEKAAAMFKGQGISLILKSIHVKFRRPVVHPDTLLIGYRPLPPPSPDPDPDPATFKVAASIYSLSQQAFVIHSEEELVWYDYDTLKKADPGEQLRSIVWGRMDAHKKH